MTWQGKRERYALCGTGARLNELRKGLVSVFVSVYAIVIATSLPSSCDGLQGRGGGESRRRGFRDGSGLVEGQDEGGLRSFDGSGVHSFSSALGDHVVRVETSEAGSLELFDAPTSRYSPQNPTTYPLRTASLTITVLRVSPYPTTSDSRIS